jgi:hypothetical protein
MAVAAWPFRFRLRTAPEGLQVSWLFVKESVRWEEIRSAQLRIDDRQLVVGRRKPVLVLERHGSGSVTLRGESSALSRLTREISAHLGPPRRQGRDPSS